MTSKIILTFLGPLLLTLTALKIEIGHAQVTASITTENLESIVGRFQIRFESSDFGLNHPEQFKQDFDQFLIEIGHASASTAEKAIAIFKAFETGNTSRYWQNGGAEMGFPKNRRKVELIWALISQLNAQESELFLALAECFKKYIIPYSGILDLEEILFYLHGRLLSTKLNRPLTPMDLVRIYSVDFRSTGYGLSDEKQFEAQLIKLVSEIVVTSSTTQEKANAIFTVFETGNTSRYWQNGGVEPEFPMNQSKAKLFWRLLPILRTQVSKTLFDALIDRFLGYRMPCAGLLELKSIGQSLQNN